MTRVARRKSRTGLGLALLLCFPLAALSGQQNYRIAPPGAWVKPLTADLTGGVPPESTSAGYELLLMDRQDRVGNAGDLEGYFHIAYRVFTQQAVEDRSQLELSFDPTYQQLILHQITVIRDGQAIDQLQPERLRVVSRETERDYNIFDGSLSVVAVLEGVKPGDVVEYSFTRVGNNPVYAGHYMRDIALQSTVPFRDLRFRLLWPAARHLYIRQHQTTLDPVVSPAGAQQEYVWSAHAVPARVVEPSLPSWYDPLPSIQLSDFASWGEVARWGASLFGDPGPLPPELRNRIAGIRSAETSPAARVLAALRYAQDEVRYLGVEIGVNSHRPYPLDTVLRRGYGDCKDKAQLLVAMLRELGIPAHPVLVSTTYREHVHDLHPTANEFDHAIVQAEVDGKTHWLDPTGLYQRGDLENVAAEYGAGLVLGAGHEGLTPIPDVPGRAPLTEIEAIFHLGGVADPVTMVVHTTVRGSAAEGLRSQIRANSGDKLQKDYTEFYTNAYPGIRSDSPPRFEDDETANVIRSEEHYTIPGFWHKSQDQQGYLGTFDPLELADAIPALSASERTMPLGVRHPTRYRYQIRAVLAAGWGVEPEADSVRSEALRFVRRVSAADTVLTLGYEYETLADHVSTRSAPEHLEKVSRIRRLLTFSVTPPSTATAGSAWSNPGELNWPILLAALMITGALVVAALRVSRAPAPAWPHHPEVVAPVPAEPALTGLGGWLILVGLGVVISPVKLAIGIAQTGPSYAASAWATRTAPTGTGYHPLWAPVLLYELAVNIGLLVFSCLLVWHFFRRSRWFPALFVTFGIARIVLLLLDTWLASQIPTVRAHSTDWAREVGAWLIVALWIGYMFRSKRVQNTFVR